MIAEACGAIQSVWYFGGGGCLAESLPLENVKTLPKVLEVSNRQCKAKYN